MPEHLPPHPLQQRGVRLLGWNALACVGAVWLLLGFAPEALLQGRQAGAGPALVHLLVLGGVLGAYYVLQPGFWLRLYQIHPVLPWLHPLLGASQVGGVLLLCYGFLKPASELAQVGGSCLILTGIALSVGQGVATALRRPEGVGWQAVAHLPGLGLLVSMTLGAMLVVDAPGGRAGVDLSQLILVHASAGVFLFFLSFLRCLDWVKDGAAREEVLLRLLLPAGAASLGVLALALAGSWGLPGREGLALGLGMLGTVALWVGLPAWEVNLDLAVLRRSFWCALGVLLLYGAIRAYRGADMEEALLLIPFVLTLLLFVLMLPEVLTRLDGYFQQESLPLERLEGETLGAPPLFEALLLLLLLFVGGLLLTAQLLGGALLVRLAALPGLVLLLWQAWRMRR